MAQFVPGSVGTQSEKTDDTGLNALIEQARKDGSTVIIVSPNNEAENPAAEAASVAQTEQFFQARSQVQKIVQSAHELLPNMLKTLELASPNGSGFWIFQAAGTALLGLFLGSLATRPIMVRGREYFRYMYDPNPATSADKAKYLIFRVILALVYIGIFFCVAMAVAVILDTAHEPSRRIIFEIIIAYLAYRFLVRAVSWNVFAYDAPSHRVVNLTDEEANTIHRDWMVAVAIAVMFAAFGRFFSFTAEELNFAGLTVENVQLLQIISAIFATLILMVLTIKNWKAWQHIFCPKSESAFLYRVRRAIAFSTPVVFMFYMLAALAVFVFRLALDLPNPGIVIAAPFFVFWMALIGYGVSLIIIQAIYNRRLQEFEERKAAELERQQAERAEVDEDAGEEMVVNVSSDDFEYQPIFKPYFEAAVMAIITALAFGEFIRTWGVKLSEPDSVWATIINIALAVSLCWIAYRAVSVFIDKRMELEGGVPEQDEEAGGEGGGAGATRMATLLPIFRYVLITLILSIAVMVTLSGLGFDIGPIFAGAGVVGIAVGFGAQTLIRDVFSGAFFLLDDAFRKGEYVEIGNIRGVVEKISVRSFQLRHHLGALHTIPFGEITQLTNYSRDWVMMKLPLRVTYDTDVEKVRKLVKKLGQQLLEHPQIGHTFLQPLKSQGVYKMEDSAMIIRVKFMTKPGEQFVTRKVVYESIQDLFAREGIKFAHKEVTVRLADNQSTEELTDQQKKAITAVSRSVIDQELEEAKGESSGEER